MDWWMSVTGDGLLDQNLQKLIDDGESNTKSVNAAMRKACKSAVKEIVLPAVLDRIRWRTGFLESQLVVRAAKRSRTRIGYWVGFPDPLFVGDTFYGGFIEFGWDHRMGVHVKADSFLRKPLYDNVNEVLAHVRQYMERWIAEANQMGHG